MIINDKDHYIDIMAKFIEALGYTDIKRAGNDSTVNMLAKKDGKIYAFACKYDIDAIGAGAMEDFIASAKKSGVDTLVFMTNSSFSSAAKKAGEAAGVELWDRNYIDRIAIGVDVRLEEREEKRENHSGIVIAIAVAVIVLAVAAALYFNPSLLDMFKK